MESQQYCTILAVERVICTEIFGLPFWVGFLKLIDQNTDIMEGIIYFTKKTDVLKLEIGDRLPSQAVLNPTPISNSRDTSFNG